MKQEMKLPNSWYLSRYMVVESTCSASNIAHLTIMAFYLPLLLI